MLYSITQSFSRSLAPSLEKELILVKAHVMAHNYDVGTRAWQSDFVEGWIASEVAEKRVEGDQVSLIFQLENGEVRYSPNMLLP